MEKVCPIEGCDNEGVVECHNAKYCYYTETCPQEFGWNKFCLEHAWAVKQKLGDSSYFCDPCIKHPLIKECYGYFVYAWKTSDKKFPKDFEEKWRNGEVFYTSTFEPVPIDEPMKPKDMKITSMGGPPPGSGPCSVEGCNGRGNETCARDMIDCPYGDPQQLCKNHIYYLSGINNHNERSCRKCLKTKNEYCPYFGLAIYYQGKYGIGDAISENRAFWILTGEKVTKESYKEYINGGSFNNKHLYYNLDGHVLE